MAAVIRPAQDVYIDRDALIDRDMILLWLYWGLFWLVLTPTVGVIISTYFNYPGYLGNALEVQFGRLRPIHINGVLFGAFSLPFLRLCFYNVARVAGVRVFQEQWGRALAWTWNLNLAAGLLSLMLGYNQGFEAGE